MNLARFFEPPKWHSAPRQVSVALANRMKEHPGAKVCVPCGGRGTLPGYAKSWAGPGRPPSRCWSCEGEGFTVPTPGVGDG